MTVQGEAASLTARQPRIRIPFIDPSRLADVGPPLLGGIVFLLVWELAVRYFEISHFVLPAPTVIFGTMVADFPYLMRALLNTATVTLAAFACALASGITLGVLLTQNRAVERVFWPYAVALQVTPMIAIAPLVVIWVGLDRVWLALMLLAWIVAFFPMLSNTAIGMKSADRGLSDVFRLYRATRWQRFRRLQLPSALPYILAGARISSGLSVIGAVVAEFVGGSGSFTGLAWVIIEAGTLLNVPRMFAALFVLSAFGLSIWYLTATVQKALLQRWHESEMAKDA